MTAVRVEIDAVGLDEFGEEPNWRPVQTAHGMGLYLLVHPQAAERMSELDRVDMAGRTAIARPWLWFGGGIATMALVILAQRV